MKVLGESSRAVFNNYCLEIVTDGVHDSCQDTVVCRYSANSTKGYFPFTQPVFKSCFKKCRKSRLGEPQIFIFAIKFINYFPSLCPCKGMGSHFAFKYEILFVKCIGGKDNRPSFLPECVAQTVNRIDYPPSQLCNWKIPVINKIIFDHVDDQKGRLFNYSLFIQLFPS